MKKDRLLKSTSLLAFLIISFACNNDPKVIDAKNEEANKETTTGIFMGDSSHAGHVHSTSASTSIGEDMHTIIAKETLTTEKYIYILVGEEGLDDFWIATTKQEIIVGNMYFFRDGLLKTNFESREHKKTFDKIFFVSKLVPADHGNSSPSSAGSSPISVPDKKIDRKGSVKISDLIASPKKYTGKTIQVSGKCVKININIMGRNWIHINDGTTEKYDLVITSASAVQVGQNFTITGTVVLDKDFGSGYRYDILLENGVLVK